MIYKSPTLSAIGNSGDKMTLIEEAVILLEKLPEENQHLIVDLFFLLY